MSWFSDIVEANPWVSPVQSALNSASGGAHGDYMSVALPVGGAALAAGAAGSMMGSTATAGATATSAATADVVGQGASSSLSGMLPLLGGAANYFGGVKTNEANRDIANAQMNFQERMSSTAHQREVEDLLKAGLNPIMSANSGASTPSGAGIAAQNPVSGALSSAIEIKGMQNSTEMKNGQLGLMAKQGEAASASANASNANAETSRASKKLLDQELPKKAAEGNFYKKYGEGAVMYDKVIQGLQGLLGVGSTALGIGNMMQNMKNKTPKEIYIDKNTGEIIND